MYGRGDERQKQIRAALLNSFNSLFRLPEMPSQMSIFFFFWASFDLISILGFLITYLLLEQQFLQCGLGTQGSLRPFWGDSETRNYFLLSKTLSAFSPSFFHSCTLKSSRGYPTCEIGRFYTETDMRRWLSCAKPDIEEICKMVKQWYSSH